MKLAVYFSPDNLPRTLRAHARFVSTKPEWKYKNRLALYPLATTAFSSNRAIAKPAFFNLFTHLRQHWQLIRPAKKFMAWEKVYQLISQSCTACSRRGHLTIRNIHSLPTASQRILRTLTALKQIKQLPSGRPSIMAISKLLHFFNPELFLVYDGEFIENGLLKEFSTDWKSFSDYPISKSKHFSPYIKYLYFANNLLRQCSKDFPRVITAHVAHYADRIPSPSSNIPTCFMFEMLALGALQRQRHK